MAAKPTAQVSDLGKPRLRCTKAGAGTPGMSKCDARLRRGPIEFFPSNTWLNLMASAALVPGHISETR